MRGLPDELTRDGVSPLSDVEKLVIEGRYGRAELALRRLEALIPSLAQSADNETLLLALYGRALLLRQLGAGTQDAIGACDVLERAAHEREAELWVATACALRARFRVDSGDIGGATADLARADAEMATGDLTGDTGYRLLDGLALVYAGLRLHDRGDEVRTRIEHSIRSRRLLDQAQHWSTWSGELAARAMEPFAGGAHDPDQDLMGRAIEIAAKLDDLPEDEVPATLRRGARGVRALSAAYRGRPSEALRLLGPDAFGTVSDLPLIERQVVSLAAMRAHALVGSLATARSLDDAATGSAPTTLPNLVLEVCRTRERLWLESYAGGDVIPVLHRMTELLVRLGWRGMDLVADTARQALEHQALRTESRTDALTGVGNRRALDEELRQLLRFGPLPLALILIDVDHFKDVNDRFTHVVGDEVLRRVAASLSMQLRSEDQLLRYGGDEFVVLLPGTGDEEANAVAERMREAVAARPWNELADGLPVSVTTGVAAVWSLSGRRPDADAEKLFRRADERLLDGKRSRPEESRGRGRANSNLPPEITPDSGSAAGDQTDTARTALSSGLSPTEASADPPRLRPQPLTALASDQEPAATSLLRPPVVDLSTVARPKFQQPAATEAAEPTSDEAAPQAPKPFGAQPAPARSPGLEPVTEILPVIAGSSHLFFDSDDEDDDEDDVGAQASTSTTSTASATRHRDGDRSGNGPQARPGRPARAVFDPDPDIDLDAAAPGASTSPRPSGRRDGRPRTGDQVEHAHSQDAEKPAVGSVTPMRSRREARAANRIGADARQETSASRAAAEAEAAAREVAQAEADEARKRQAWETDDRERAARETEAREQRETQAREQAAREQAHRETEARQQVEREAAAREQAAREQAAREHAEREHAERERAAREQAAREQAEIEAAAREAEARERAAREAEARERAAREKAAREQALREAAAREKAARERTSREKAAREAAAREAEAREKAAREAAEAEREEEAERARAEAEARAELLRREAEGRVRAERARVERERREAEAREAKLIQEAEEREAAMIKERARAKAEREASAAQRIREEAYARDVERARLAAQADGGYLDNAQLPYQPTAFEPPTFEPTPPTFEPTPPAAEPPPAAPTFRRAPLYDSNRYPDEPPTLGHSPDDEPEPLPEDRRILRARRDPFGPPTSRTAIIDLSARKRPRK